MYINKDVELHNDTGKGLLLENLPKPCELLSGDIGYWTSSFVQDQEKDGHRQYIH